MANYYVFQSGSNNNIPTLSATAVNTTPARMRAVAARTGLSPEFHFAVGSMGKAGSFWRSGLRRRLVDEDASGGSGGCRNQSVKSQRSKARVPFVGGDGVGVSIPSVSVVVLFMDVVVAGSDPSSTWRLLLTLLLVANNDKDGTWLWSVASAASRRNSSK